MSDYNSSLPIRTETAGDVIAKIADKTITSQQLAVNADGSVNITDNGSSLTVDATNLDIRDLSASQDNVAISDGTDTLAVNADGSINSVVTATNLDIRDLSHTQDSIKIGDGTDFLAIDASGNIGVTDAGGSLTVDGAVSASNFPATVDTDYGTVGASTIRVASQIGNATGAATFGAGSTTAQTLRVASNLYDETGTAFSSSNPLPVVQVESEGTEINDYSTATVAGGGTSNHNYTVTALKTLQLTQINASASGKAKIEVQTETGVATGVFNTKFVQFNSTATPNMEITLKEPIAVAAGVRVRIIRTNKDNQSQDLYSTISGHEV